MEEVKSVNASCGEAKVIGTISYDKNTNTFTFNGTKLTMAEAVFFASTVTEILTNLGSMQVEINMKPELIDVYNKSLV